MVMGFLGCLGAIYEIRCLLGLVSIEQSVTALRYLWPLGVRKSAGGSDLDAFHTEHLVSLPGSAEVRLTSLLVSLQYFTCLLLILIAQLAAGAVIYFQKAVVSDVTSSSCSAS